MLNSKGLTELRHEIVHSYTNGRTSSTKDLSDFEIDGIISLICDEDDLNLRFGSFEGGNRQHSYILSLCYELGWTRWKREGAKTVADLRRLGAFLRSDKAKVRKPLRQQNKKECQLTIYQLEQMVNKQHSK